jgi:hypothetical protein
MAAQLNGSVVVRFAFFFFFFEMIYFKIGNICVFFVQTSNVLMSTNQSYASEMSALQQKVRQLEHQTELQQKRIIEQQRLLQQQSKDPKAERPLSPRQDNETVGIFTFFYLFF